MRIVCDRPALSVQKFFHFSGVDPATGLYQFATAQGDYSTPDNVADKTVLISGDPAFLRRSSNTFRYKGFELDVVVPVVKQKGPIILRIYLLLVQYERTRTLVAALAKAGHLPDSRV